MVGGDLRKRLGRTIGLTAALCALSLAVPALAASDHALGDGSSTDNARLLPNLYPAEPVLESGEWLGEPYHPFFDVDWSVALRGAYTKATDSERFDIRLVPTVGLEHIGTRSAINLDASAELVRPNDTGNIELGGLRLGLQTGYNLDSVTRLTGTGSLVLSQPLPGTPGVASNIAIPSQQITGSGEIGLTRQFGKFNVGVTGALARNVYGPTTLNDGTVTDNTESNYWSYDGGLRVGFEATPIFEVFGQAGLGRDAFDVASTGLGGIKPDASDVTLRGGVTGRWNSILEATVSTGVGVRRFDEASLGEIVTQLYDASIVFTPDPTWRFIAGFATNVAPPGPNNGGTTRVDYLANAGVNYTVNSWLALRAQANWNRARFEGSANTETGYGLSAGADYKVNAHTAVTADYGYNQTESTANGLQEAHQVTMGITISR